jgi:hypothetical protein
MPTKDDMSTDSKDSRESKTNALLAAVGGCLAGGHKTRPYNFGGLFGGRICMKKQVPTTTGNGKA